MELVGLFLSRAIGPSLGFRTPDHQSQVSFVPGTSDPGYVRSLTPWSLEAEKLGT